MVESVQYYLLLVMILVAFITIFINIAGNSAPHSFSFGSEIFCSGTTFDLVHNKGTECE